MLPRFCCQLLIVFCLLGFAACGGSGPVSKDRADGKLAIFVSIPPQAGFVRAIGGERVAVASFAGEGQDPHQISVQPKQMAALNRAHAYFSVGMPFEKHLVEKLREQDDPPLIVDTTAGIKLLRFDEGAHDHGAHDHDDGHDHEHGESDPHVWLAPEKIEQQVKNIAAALKQLAPEHAAEFDHNLAEYLGKLEALDRAISTQMEPLLGKTFFVYHPAFGYFADAYGLYQEPVQTGGQSPTPKALVEFIAHARADGAKIIFVQPQFDRSKAETVAKEIGGRVVPMDPLAEDVLANLKSIADNIAGALAP